MKINKEMRRLSRELLRASFTDGRLDQGKVAALVQSLVTRRPRYYMDILEHYKRLLRLELQKRQAVIESAVALEEKVSKDIVARLKRRYGQDLATEFRVDPALLGGVRIRVGSDVWDGTVRDRLHRLEQQL